MFLGAQNTYEFGLDQANVLVTYMVALSKYSPSAEGRADSK